MPKRILSVESKTHQPENFSLSLAQQAEKSSHRTKSPRARFAPEYEVLLTRLIDLRKAKGVTQVQLSQAIGKTQSHVSMCENRERELSVLDLWRWCLALDIPLSDFMRELEKEVVPGLNEFPKA